MRIYKYLHSCVVLEKDDERILFDPGSYSFVEGKVRPDDFGRLAAVFVTHNHADHCDVPALKTILASNPGVPLFTNRGTQELLTREGVKTASVGGGETQVGPFRIRAVEATHEKTLLPAPQNTAYLVDGVFLHPGDSFDAALTELRPAVLALPCTAPWLTHLQAAEFAKAVRPRIALPIHDGYAKEFFLERQYRLYADYLRAAGVVFSPLPLWECLEV